MVRRARRTILLSDKQADDLAKAVGNGIKRAWLTESGHTTEEEVLKAGREYLDEKGLAALSLAFSQGYYALKGGEIRWREGQK